jgi:cell division protein FtsI (penicillin-binding protein 3)
VIAAPSKDIYGSMVSGTVFAAIANKVYSTHLKYQRAINEERLIAQVTPPTLAGNREDLEVVLDKLNVRKKRSSTLEWVTTIAKEHYVEIADRELQKGQVPNVLGMGLRDALYLLGNEGLVVNVVGKGRVVNQSLIPGMPSSRGGYITIELR